MKGMRRVRGEDLLRERVHGETARERRAVLAVVPELVNEERLRLEVFGKLVDDLLHRLHERGAALALLLFRLRKIRRPRVDPDLLPPTGRTLFRHRHLHEIGRAFLVVHVGHGHAPVGHRALRIERRHLAKGTLRLEIPKPVELPHALREKILREFVLRRDRKAHVARPRHQHRRLARTLVECLAMQRVAGGFGFVRLCRGRLCRLQDGAGEDDPDGKRRDTHGAGHLTTRAPESQPAPQQPSLAAIPRNN